MTGENGESDERSTITKMLPVRMTSLVVRGFGRGSKDLGIPTANLDLEKLQSSSEKSLVDFPTGIYWGFARIGDTEVYTAAVSIGYNPTYGNESKTIEPHLIAPEGDPRRHASKTGETIMTDFYDHPCRLSLTGYLRPELPFEGLDKLIAAIKNDIVNSVNLSKEDSEVVRAEKAWVQSQEPVTTV